MKISPSDELFLSGSEDNTIRFWDFRIQCAQGLIKHDHKPLIAFDPCGQVFAVAYNSTTIELYDVRTFDFVSILCKYANVMVYNYMLVHY